MVWDNDYDVKEYRPKKRGGDTGVPFPENAFTEFARREMEIADRDGGVTMSMSEILDFSEGADSPEMYS